MNKLLAYSFLLLSFSFASCDKDDDDDNQKIAPATVTIEGTWQSVVAERAAYDANGTLISTKKDKLYPIHKFTFSPGSAYHEEVTTGNPRSWTGSYAFSNSAVTISMDSIIILPEGVYQVDTLTAGRLVMQTRLQTSSPSDKQILTIRAIR